MNKARDHLQTLVGNVVDLRASEPSRAGAARLLADHAHDLRSAVTVGTAVLDAGEVTDVLRAQRGDRDAAARNLDRAGLRELRAAIIGPAGGPVLIGDPVATGHQTAAPLIRLHAIPTTGADGTTPVIPGVTGGGPAVVDPDLANIEVAAAVQVTVGNVNTGGAWNYASAYVNVSRQVSDFIDPTGEQLLDAALHDLVDVAAEKHIVAALQAAAGGTRVVGTGGAGLDAAEAVAGQNGNGAAWLLITSPHDWPTVRRQLAAAWGDGPHPEPVVTMGATPGTVTLVGPDALVLLAAPVEVFKSDEPRLLRSDVGMTRPFKLSIRNASAIQTVTGV